MKKILLILAVVALAGCGEKSPTVKIADPVVEKAIRGVLEKPTGKLTEADLEQVTYLYLSNSQLTDVPKGLEKLNQLTRLDLYNNPDITKAQIDELQKAVPNCEIRHDATK